MRIGFVLFSTIAVVVAFGINSLVSGQKKAANFSEFSALRSQGFSRVFEGPRRVESLTEHYLNGEIVSSDYYLNEVLGDERRRYVARKMEGGKTTEVEVITIGYFQYSRTDQGKWTKIDLRTAGRGSGSGSGTGTGSSNCSVRQFTLEHTFLENYSVRLFEELFVSNGKDGLELEETKTWIGDDGALLQEEVIKGSFSPRIISSRRLSKYEANPNIKIEAPIE